MVTISNADKALKTFYLGVLADQLNVGVNPLFAKIGQTSADVWGKEIKKLAPFGLNGGIGSGTESDELPQSGGNNYAQFTLTLKNLFGKIEISDKAVRASENSVGAFVNLLNAEMEGLLKASKFNFGRMLFGDGSGLVATTVANATNTTNAVSVDSLKGLVEGMIVDIYKADGTKEMSACGSRIMAIERTTNSIYLSLSASKVLEAGYKIYVQGSKGNEITGLGALFGDGASIYGLSRESYSFLNPYKKTVSTGVSVDAIQSAIDAVDELSGGNIDIIVSSYSVRKKYVESLTASRTNLDYMTLDGGYKALSYAGIPFVADRFAGENDMYLLNSADFKLHQLCDWRWLEGESGSVLHQVPGKACYSATLVKYADLLCSRPMGQAKITFSGSEKAYYTVGFDSVGGSAVGSQTVLPGNKATKPVNPTKSGATFGNWLDNGAAFNFDGAVNKDCNLVASWL